MKRILITGATGNVGREVIHYLFEQNSTFEVFAAVRDVEKSRSEFSGYPNLGYRQFDFENKDSFKQAFREIDVLFLLRPPHISRVEKYFTPLLQEARNSGVKKLIFLSVQGAEKSTVIPHNKIEKLITSMGFEFIFVRPGYFMQNLTTTLLPEIRKSQTITLPAGKAKFNWIDVKNIAEACAALINGFDQYKNGAFEITGKENIDFREVANFLSGVTGIKIGYRSINPLSFYLRKKQEGVRNAFALVMTLLHFLPRLQKEPEISANYQMLTGKEPTTLMEFIHRESSRFRP